MKIPVAAPTSAELSSIIPDRSLFDVRLGPAPDGKYRHWDTFRHVAPPSDWSVAKAWLAVKLARRSLYRELPLLDLRGQPFVFALPNPALEMLHRIDRDAGGSIRGDAMLTQVV